MGPRLANIRGGNPPPCNGSNSPFLSTIGNNYALATQYNSVNPGGSQPNYVGLIGGSTFNCGIDSCPANINATNLVDSLEKAGLTWKAYMENQTITAGCDLATTPVYEHEHNPFVSFSNIVNNSTRCQNIVLANPSLNATCTTTDCTLINDLNSNFAANFMWLTPNDCNNMHGGSLGICPYSSPTSIVTGDNYLKSLVPDILKSRTFNTTRSALFIVFDEGTNFCPVNPGIKEDCVYAAWAGSAGVTKMKFVSSNFYNDYSYLRTIESNWNLPTLTANDAAASPMAEFFAGQQSVKLVSWNPKVPCTPLLETVEQIIGNQTNSKGGASESGSIFSPGITNSTYGPDNTKSWLSNSTSTPPGWKRPGTPCVITNSQGDVISAFVQINGVQRDFINFSASTPSTQFKTINGGTTYPNGAQSDSSFNILTPGYGTASTNCQSGNATADCMHSLSVTIDKDWKGASYCGPYTACDDTSDYNGLVNRTQAYKSLIDVQGFVFWNPALNNSSHNFSGWELHPFTAWRESTTAPDFILSATISSSSGATGPAPTLTMVPSQVTLPINGKFVAFSQLNVTTASLTSGTYNIAVSGTIGTLTRTTLVTVVMVGFTLLASPPVLSVAAGSTVTSTVTLTSHGSFNGTVTFSSPQSSCGCASGVLATSSLILKAGGTNSTSLIVEGSNYGNATITLTASSSSPAFSASTNVLVKVYDFSATDPQHSLTTNAGTSVSTTISVSSLNRFNGTVTLVASSSPSGPSITLSPSLVTLTSGNTVPVLLSFNTGKAGTYSLTVNATSGSLFHLVAITVTVQDFNITSVSSLQVNAGSTGTATVAITSLSGFSGTVALTDAVPSGLACGAIIPSSIVGSGSATVSCGSSISGNYTLTVTGTSNSLSHTVHVILNIVDFTVSAGSVTPASINVGSIGSSIITVNAVNGFSRTVSLTFSAQAGLTCSLSTSKLALPPSPAIAILSCSSTTANNYSVIVTATNDTLFHTTTAISFHVVDFTITSNISTLIMLVGQESQLPVVTFGASNGFAGTLTVNVIVSPSGPAATPLFPSVRLTTASNTTGIDVKSGQLAGVYTLNLTGTNGQLTHSVIMTLTVQDFRILPSPVSVTVLAGTAGTSTITGSSLDGFSGTVVLSDAVSPSTGLICSLSPTSLAVSTTTPNATSILSCSGSAGAYTVTITGSSNGVIHTASVSYKVQDFTVSASPTSVTVFLGSSTSSTITVAGLQGFTGTVTLTDNISPSIGLICTLIPGSVALNATTTSGTSTLSCIDSATSGTFTVTVTGTAGGLSRSASITYTVGTAFTVTANPTNVNTITGSTGKSTITVTYAPTFIGTVTLNYTVSPSTGLSCSLSVTSFTGSGNSTLSCSGSEGLYSVTVNGTGGQNTASTTVNYTVQDFAITASPTSVTVVAGTAGTSTITMTAFNGFAGSVNLATNSTSCTASPTSVTGSGTSALSCNFSSTGVVHVGVTGTSGSLSHSATVTFTVQDFTLTVSPTTVTVSVGSAGTSTITVAGLQGFSGVVTLTTNSTSCTVSPTGVTGSGSATVSCTFTTASTIHLSVTGTSGSRSHSANVVYTVQDFTIAASPTSITVNAGTAAPSTITVTGLNGFASVVSLATNSTSCTVTPTSVTSSETSTLSCTFTSASTAYVTITGTSASLSHSAIVAYTVQDFTISASPTSIAVSAGTAATSTVTVTSSNGFTGVVNLATNSTSCTVSPTIVTGSGSSTLSCTFLSAGLVHVTVTGTSGSLSHSATVTYTVQDFTVATSSTSVSTNAGTAGTSTITITALQGFSGLVSLTATISPTTGLTCTLTPASVTGSGTSTLSCTGSAGTYTATVAGT